MITVGIVEKENDIENIFVHLLLENGQSIKKNKCDDTSDFIIITKGKNNDCDIVVVNEKSKEKKMEANYIFIYNSDEDVDVDFSKKPLFISYGLNSLATITASAISDDGTEIRFLYCIQRAIVTLSGKKIEPQEFPVVLKSKIGIHAALAAITLSIVSNITKEINQLFFPC